MQSSKPRAASMPKWARAASPKTEEVGAPKGKAGVRALPPKRPIGEIRIIGGAYKRTKLAVPDKAGLRPTADRVRETLFNWLGQDLSGWQCLDAFAGTGALGFECASRGASRVFMAEMDGALVAAMLKLKTKLLANAIELHKGDGLSYMGRFATQMDLVLLDPPFEANLYDKALAAASRACKPGAYVYLEAPERFADERLAAMGLGVFRHLKAGSVHAHLLVKN